MRHNKSGRKLGRTWEHRKAMFRNMAKSLLVHGKIRTTEAKAKELRKVADKLVTLALRNDLHSRRLAFKVLGDHALVKTLFDEVGPRFVGVSGGFTRVVKMGLPRRGDCAPMAFIEWTRLPGEDATSQVKDAASYAAPKAAAAAPAQQAPQQADETATSDEATEDAAEQEAAPEVSEDAPAADQEKKE